MLSHLNYILWNPDVEAFHLFGFSVRWYSLCWLIGLVLAYFIVQRLYKQQKIKDELFDPLFLYCFFGILLGARLLVVYVPQSGTYTTSSSAAITFVPEAPMPVEVAVASGTWKFVGYEGLASHGGTIGLIVALYLYYRRTRLNLWQVLDNIAIATPITACFIRLGNLMNSEIIGKVTDVPWAFIFERVDKMPRHPGQLYEAIAYFVFFFVGLWLYRKHPQRVGTGFFFGLCLTLIFTFRFFIEYTKDIQVDFESGMPLNMGQILSLPFIAIGIYCMRRKGKGQAAK